MHKEKLCQVDEGRICLSMVQGGDALHMQQEALSLQQEIENTLVSRTKVDFETVEVAK